MKLSYSIGPLRSNVMLIDESPSREVINRRRPFCDRTGNELRQWLHRGGVDINQIRCTYFVKNLISQDKDR